MNIKPEQKYHFEKNYAHNPLKIGNISLIQIGCTHCSQDFSIGRLQMKSKFDQLPKSEYLTK